MTINEKWLKDYCIGLRHCNMTKEQEKHILSLFSVEPDGRHVWREQDIYEQIRKILENTDTSHLTNKVVKYE